MRRTKSSSIPITLFAVALAVAAAGAAHAEPASVSSPPEPDKAVWTFVLENDLAAGTDRYYTNGFLLGRTSALNDVPKQLVDAVTPLIGTVGQVRWRANIGQSLYAPEDITRKQPDPNDQPYAAWLHADVGVINDVALPNGNRRQTSVMLSLGVVGPSALGEQTQDFVHDVVGSKDPQGWDEQLENEPALLLTVEQRWLVTSQQFAGQRIDAAPHVGMALGNVFTHAAAGVTFRFGEPPQFDYGPPRIQPSTPGSGYFENSGDEVFSWYVFAGIEGRTVARNIFLDGNTFEDSPSVDKNIFVADLSGGIVFTVGDLRLAYTHVIRSQEFDGQSGPSVFGGFSVGYRF